MFDDIVKEDNDYEEKVLVSKSEYTALKDNVNTKQKLIERMVTDMVALRLKIKDLESVLDGLSIDTVYP